MAIIRNAIFYLIIAGFSLSTHAQVTGAVLLAGDSYMVGMTPVFQTILPEASPVAKIGAGLNAPLWNTLNGARYSFVFVSLGINDLPKNADSVWADRYATQVKKFIDRFSPNASIHWIIPPCPIGLHPNASEVARWHWLLVAILKGVEASGHARAVLPPNTVCSERANDGLHFSREGYRQMVAATLQ